jgi:hypothetical protein
LAELLAGGFADPPVASAARSARPDTGDATNAGNVWTAVLLAGAVRGDMASTLRAARASGATRLLTGAVVSGGKRVTTRAVLTDVATGRPTATATATASPDSVEHIAARLASELLARDAGEPIERVASLRGLPPVAVRSFLAGRSAYRAGRYQASQRHFATAFRHAPAEPLVAAWLAAAANWTGDREPAKAALARAWPARAALAPPDRAHLVALAGPRFPERASAREHLDAWRAVTLLAPDRPDGWYEVGEAYFHQAEWLALDRAPAAARAAFERTLELDPTFHAARVHLVHLLAEAGEVAGVRAHARRLGDGREHPDAARFVRWRLAHLTGDGRTARAIALELGAASETGTRWLLESGVEDGVGLDDADAALALRSQRAETNTERGHLARAQHSLSLARGRPAAATAALRRMRELEPLDALNARFAVLAALFDAGDPADAGRAGAELETVALQTLSAEAPRAAYDTVAQAACVAAQWRLSRGDIPAVRRLRARLVGSPRHPADGHARACGLLLDAGTAPRTDARAAARDRLDRVLSEGAYVGRLAPYLSVAVARLHAGAGDTVRALAAVRRRPRFGRWPYYHAAGLQLEAALALASGDTAGAYCALRHHVALRGAPEPALRADAARDRAWLMLIERALARRVAGDALERAPTRVAACRASLSTGVGRTDPLASAGA